MITPLTQFELWEYAKRNNCFDKYQKGVKMENCLAAGMHTSVFETGNDDIVLIKTSEFFKYEMIKTYEKIHKVDFKLSEKIVLEKDGEENKFYMKRLYQRELSEEEFDEVCFLTDLACSSMHYDEMEQEARKKAKSKIGVAFADSLLMVLDFYENYNHGYSMLDFHMGQILFDDADECYILDILV